MQTLESFPKSCRSSIRTVAEELNIDYETAYAMLSLEAVLMDLYPSDGVVVTVLLKDTNRTKPERPSC